jgi:hypothetical protein
MEEDRVARAEDVIWREIGNEIAVIRDDGLAIFVLNKTAARIWKMCDGSLRPDEMAVKLCEEYDVSIDRASEDVSNTLTGMRAKRLLKRADDLTRKGTPGGMK